MSNSNFLFLRNLLWIILLPGTVVVLIPYLLIENQRPDRAVSLNIYGGLFLCLIGVLILLWCVYDFATKGKGTLSPADPARHLVITGLYKYSRNPMYLGVILILLGQALGYWSLTRLLYAGIVFIAFNIFIRIHEEPYLDKTFAREYSAYRNTVRRWL